MSTVKLDDLCLEGELFSENLELTSGEVVVRGQAMGKVTATGKLKAYDHEDVSTVPFYGISVADYDATDGELDSVAVYVKGNFNENKVVFEDTSDAISDIRAAARDLGIYFQAAVKSV